MVKEKRVSDIEEKIKKVSQEFLSKAEQKKIHVVSHFDTDGITSAAIIIKCLKRLDLSFDVTITKSLTSEIISKLPKNRILLFLDLASNSLDYLGKLNQDVFIIDHHEISQEIPKNVSMINPQQYKNKEEISSAGLCYLFSKHINPINKDLAHLAIIGMVGDSIENIGVCNNGIARDIEVIKKKGLLLYPSTRPIDRVLEFSHNPYIPSVTGNREEVLNLLRETSLERKDGKYKCLIDLTEKEMEEVVTSIMLRRMKKNNDNIIGNIFLIKHFNQLEDAREMSAKINAASRLGYSHYAIMYCLENSKAKKQIERLYAKYKQFLIKGLNKVENLEKIQGKEYILINAKTEISDNIIGVIASILSRSALHQEGTVIIAMAHSDKGKIKVSGRLVGNNGRNLREIFEKVIKDLGGEFGGHKNAAGCIIEQEKEQEFIKKMKKNLEIELVKIKDN